MKFTNGYWLLKDDIKAHFPRQTHSVESDKRSVTIFAPTKPINSRGDTLDGPVLTVRLSSPGKDVLRINLTHFSGVKQTTPQFELFEDPSQDVDILNDEQKTVIRSGSLEATVLKNGQWGIHFSADGRVVTSTGFRGMGIIQKESGENYIHEQLNLSVGETIYGLGERFSTFVKNGQKIDIWNQDGGTSSEQAYKNIPFYISSNGYGLFVNNPGRVSFEVGSEKTSRVQFSVPGQSLEYYLIYGPTPKEIIQKYTALTGRPALPPAWSFGLWLSTSFTTPYNEETVTEFIGGMQERDIPLDVFHFDCFWMRPYHWVDFQWDQDAFPDPQGMLKRIKAQGIKICLWLNPYIGQASVLFEEGRQFGYLLKKPNGDVWQTDLWQAGMGIVDFTNPDARRWFGDKIRTLIKLGVDSFKTDFGERIPTDVVYWDGSDPERMHNYYTYLYNRTVFDVLEEELGKDKAVVFARSATAGCQQFPLHWGGDNESTFESMAESLRGGLSLGMCGFGFWSHDIGGFEGTPPADVYKRWIAFGLLSSHSRLHGSQSYRVPWLFDEEAVEVMRQFTRLKMRLMPTLFGHAVEASKTGLPMLRAMFLEFPDDPTCRFLDRQYMLGNALLVAPVFSPDGWVQYYLPAGRWTNFLTGEVKEGPCWLEETHPFTSLPLWVRPNSVLALGAQDGHAEYDYGQGVTLQVYNLKKGQNALTVPTVSGDVDMAFEFKNGDGGLEIIRSGAQKPWQVCLINVQKITSVEGGETVTGPSGMLIKASAGANKLTIRY